MKELTKAEQIERNARINKVADDLVVLLQVASGFSHVKTDLIETLEITEKEDTADIALPDSWIKEMRDNDKLFNTAYWVWYYYKHDSAGCPKNLVEMLVKKHQYLPVQDRKDVFKRVITKLIDVLKLEL